MPFSYSLRHDIPPLPGFQTRNILSQIWRENALIKVRTQRDRQKRQIVMQQLFWWNDNNWTKWNDGTQNCGMRIIRNIKILQVRLLRECLCKSDPVDFGWDKDFARFLCVVRHSCAYTKTTDQYLFLGNRARNRWLELESLSELESQLD